MKPSIATSFPHPRTTVDEVNIHCQKQDTVLHIKYHLSSKERRELIQKTSDQASMLFEYYLLMASMNNGEITDEAAAFYFGWSSQKARRNRLLLTKAGWFKSTRYTLTDNRKGISYYIGKEAVEKHFGKKP